MLRAIIPNMQIMKITSNNTLAFLKGIPADISSRNKRKSRDEITVEKTHRILPISVPQ